MVSSYCPMDILGYIDRSITTQEQKHAEQLVQEELRSVNFRHEHPGVEQLLPLQSNMVARSMLLREIEKYEDEYPEEDNFDSFDITGINMEEYDNFEANGVTNYENIYKALSYKYLSQRQMELYLATEPRKFAISNEELSHLKDNLAAKVTQKRKAIDEINGARKRAQLEFRPLNDYLDQRWTEGVKNCIDMGVECANLEMELEERD